MKIITEGLKCAKIGLTIALLFFSLSGIQAQKRYQPKKKAKIGGGLELWNSGNYHGGMIAPSLSVNKSGNSLWMSALIQHQSRELTGLRAGYSRNLTDGIRCNTMEDEYESDAEWVASDVNQRRIFYLSAFVSAQYFHNSLISPSAARVERKISTASETNWDAFRLCTAELSAGAELNFRFSKRITWKNTVGIAVHRYLNYSVNMYHAQTAPSLLLSTGIFICPLNR